MSTFLLSLAPKAPTLLKPKFDKGVLTVTWNKVEGGSVKAYTLKGGPGGDLITNQETAEFRGVKAGEAINFQVATQFYAGYQASGASNGVGGISAFEAQPVTVRKFKNLSSVRDFFVENIGKKSYLSFYCSILHAMPELYITELSDPLLAAVLPNDGIATLTFAANSARTAHAEWTLKPELEGKKLGFLVSFDSFEEKPTNQMSMDFQDLTPNSHITFRVRLADNVQAQKFATSDTWPLGEFSTP